MSGIKNWNTSNVINMNRMLSGATNFKNDLSGWVVEQVEDNHEDFAKDIPVENIVEPRWKVKIPEGPLLGIIQCIDNDGSYIEVKIEKGITRIPEGVVEVLNWGYITQEYLDGLSEVAQ